MVNFDYLEPKSLKKACELLDQHGDEAKLIAGGTALLILMRLRLLSPKVVISLEKIPKFDRIRFSPKEGLRIGAGARHRDIELSKHVRRHYPLLHETFRKVAQPRIRNMGTIGGNLSQGDPLTDPGASLMALDTEVVLTSSKGSRTLPIDSFFVDYYETALQPGEILTEIRVPPPEKKLAWAHIKFTPRTEEDFATIGIALALKGQNGHCEDVRLALNSASSTIFRAKKAEEVVRGKQFTDELLGEMGRVAADEADPIDDLRGSPDYKRDLIKVLVKRAAKQALEQVKD